MGKLLRTLYSKLAFALVILLFLVGIFYALLSQTLLEESRQSGHQQINRELASNLAHEMKLVSDGKVDLSTMHEIFHMAMLLNPGIEIYYLDLQGRILDFAAEPSTIKRRTIDLAPVNEFLAGESMYPVLGDDPRHESLSKSFSVAVLPNNVAPQGYLYVVLQSSKLDQAYEREKFQGLPLLGLWALLGSLAMGLPVGLLLFYYLTRRIRKLDDAVRQFSKSGYKSSSPSLALIPEKRKSQ